MLFYLTLMVKLAENRNVGIESGWLTNGWFFMII